MSSNNSKELGLNAYERGHPITSLNFTTIDFAGKQGTYYVRALIVGNDGNSYELVSNKITTKGSVLQFSYEGSAKQIVLAKGSYKLEVWGGQGGSQIGSRANSSSGGTGGKGGYSKGTISLVNDTKLFIFVGGQGKSGDATKGAETKGGFPDGGVTKTYYQCNYDYKSVPGSGGGSSSIRVSSDSLYARVIVAGGGGGADGDAWNINNGGFGGGIRGGNGYSCGKIRDRGAGTQSGSSPGPNRNGPEGISGTFGKGADGRYKSDSNSGGAGGGGWYGGGGGGHGNYCHGGSGGGGSGWVFTESNLNSWKNSDKTNADKFMLDSSLCLTDSNTISGDSSFPNPNGGLETGHSGDGYAKITPI